MFKRGVIGAVCLCFATEAAAQEVVLRADSARGALDRASLLRQLDDDAVPQDYVAAARADYRRLLTALYAEGYYSGTISITIDGVEAATLSPLASVSRIGEVVISVDAGPEFTFGQARVAPLPGATALLEAFAIGQPAKSDQIGRAVSAGISAWRDAGYAKARVGSQQITARHAARVLDADVAIATGPRLTFGPLAITGNSAVRSARIAEIAGLPEGAVFSPAEIDKSERRLRRTGTFDSVALREAEEIGPDNTLPITAQIAEAKPRRVGFGLELSTIEGLTTSAFWLHRNLFGGAERFRVEGEVSGISGETGGIDYALGASFTRPATFGPDTDLYLRGSLSREDEPEFLLDKAAIEGGFTRILRDDLTVQAGLGLLYAREETASRVREYTLFTLPLKATLERRDEPADAKEGYFLDIEATPFISSDGDLSGALLAGDGRAYLSFGASQQFTLAGRAQLGSVIGAGLDSAPADFLFYSGGGGSVRGQPYQSLGVTRDTGSGAVTTGGASFAGAQLEARYAIRDNISLVGFYDAGYIGETSALLTDGDRHAGAGIGLRYNTGIGPIRLDLGTQASGENAGESLQVYIGIGQAF